MKPSTRLRIGTYAWLSPGPRDGARDRSGLKHALGAMRKQFPGKMFLGGQSYGGRQASMLLSEEPTLAEGLLLLSYPLHPPNQPEKMRTQHLPSLMTPTLFISGTKDPFGTPDEIEAARKLIPAKAKLVTIEGVGHDLGFTGKKGRKDIPGIVLEHVQHFFV